MAQRVEVTLIDDLDGEKADETVQFSVDGAAFEIDLSAKNAASLREDLQPWIRHARRGTTARRGGRAAAGPASRRQDLAKIREWARANGHDVSDRGRVAADIQRAYDAAH